MWLHWARRQTVLAFTGVVSGFILLNLACYGWAAAQDGFGLIEVKPEPGGRDVPLLGEVELVFNRPVRRGRVQVDGATGNTTAGGCTLRFRPIDPFLPNQRYTVRAVAVSVDGEMARIRYSFRTVDMTDQLWVRVDLSPVQLLTVYRGSSPVRDIMISGGAPGQETPLGVFRIKDRGRRFFSRRFGEGALWWVRLVDQYLFHSLPRDETWEVIPAEKEKLGLPASHGCIRMSDEDAKWFYEQVPPGALVIIHQ